VQVNVDGGGNNVLGDAANEPSIAINPLDPDEIVIAWRQFDSVVSNFREAGYAYSHDGGQTWTFPGVIENGTFRSDPVLGADADGNFYYSSLTNFLHPDGAEFRVRVFKSTDGGVTFPTSADSFGGDKQWMAIDRTSGIGQGNVYSNWNVQATCCPATDFARSTNAGASFEPPLMVPEPSLKWGTSEVGPDGTLYLSGASLNQAEHVIARSSNAQDPGATQVFDLVDTVDLGGETTFGGQLAGTLINPVGLLGQVNVATDHSDRVSRGNVYMLGSVVPDGSEQLDVMFVRSSDGGETWSAPARVNDDPAPSDSWQWFGTLAVAPNGRIDAVWNDTRNDPGNVMSEVFHSWSLDAGLTWSANVAVSPVFDPTLGFPNQDKMGDYYHMSSDNGGANLAYAATFNGEQDVYFLRISADCDANGIEDDCDISCGPAGGRCDVAGCGVGIDDDANEVLDLCDPDSDGDGVVDAADSCPDSDLEPTVVIDGCDSGVGNQLFADGCTMTDLLSQCADEAVDNPAYVSCVAALLQGWKKDGLIVPGEQGAIRSCAAQTTFP
jgi:hypothetical protein